MSEEKAQNKKVQVKIPAEVAKIMKQWGGREIKLAAARGSLPMSGAHLVTVLFVFCYGKDDELKKEALRTLKGLSPGILASALSQEDVIPEILDLVARVRYRELEVMEPLLTKRRLPLKTLLFLAEHAPSGVLEILSNNDEAILKSPNLKTLILNNPNAGSSVKAKLSQPSEPEHIIDAVPEVDAALDVEEDCQDDFAEEEQDDFADDVMYDEVEEEGELSKYQQLLDMQVSEKIKMAITGDKEWRTLLLRESNKLVTSAVLKNPRISESEVVVVAKNRAASDDMIRIILLNKEWTKLYEIKKALAVHPRTPLQKAMRFLGFLTEKDLKDVARSKNVPQAIVNTARRLLSAKENKR